MSWWNPFDNSRYTDNLSSAIFNLAPSIKKIRQANEILDELLKAIGEQTFAKRKILSEIERLKRDKWDDEGFDRLYALVDREILEDPEVK